MEERSAFALQREQCKQHRSDEHRTGVACCRCGSSAHHSLEHLRVLGGERRENLAVELDVSALEISDEAAVAHAERPGAGVDADVPELTEVPLLLPPVHERVLAGLEERLVRTFHLRLPAP